VNSVVVMPRYRGSSNPSGESSSSQTNGSNDARAKCQLGSLRHGKSKRQLPGRDDDSDEQPEDDDDREHLPDPSSPQEADQRRGDITHDTDICLEILVDSKDEGHFLHLQTSVKVCCVT
jgi:hypothetical protein